MRRRADGGGTASEWHGVKGTEDGPLQSAGADSSPNGGAKGKGSPRAKEEIPAGGLPQSVDAVLARVEAKYGPTGEISHIDGLSVEYPDWRFNLRKSNTEPVIRLNVETRGDRALCQEKTEELLALIRA